MKGLFLIWCPIIVLVAAAPSLFGQEEPANMVKYTAEFRFKEGIYPNFFTVQQNNPIPKTSLVTEADLFSRKFYEQVTEEKTIAFYDSNGVLQELKTSNVWGYGRNGVLYINIAGRFHRISFVGSICHLVATVTTYNPGYYDPYYNRNYYYDRYYRNPQGNYGTTEVLQYLIDFETGQLMEFNVESVEIILMKDPELYQEYMDLRRKKKKQYKFVYIRKYNERNPLYFPSN